MEKRTLLAMVLMLLVLLGWGYVGPKLFPAWFPQPAEEGVAPAEEAAPEGGEAPVAEAEPEAPAAPPEAEAGGEEAAGPRPTALPEQRVVLENEVVRAVFTNRGAALAEWVLKGDRFENDVDPEDPEAGTEPVNLVEVAPGQPRPFSTTFEELPWGPDASYAVVASSEEAVTFEARAGGAVVRKTYRLTPERYHLDLDLQVGGSVGRLTPTVRVARQVEKVESGGGFLGRLGKPMPDTVKAVCAYEGDIERREFDEDETQWSHSGDIRWTGIDSRYFLTAVFQGRPAFAQEDKETAPSPGTCTLDVPQPDLFEADLALDPMVVPAGGTAEARLTGYLGPKFKTRLTAYGHGLDESIDFGFFTILSLGLLWVMVFFENLVGNWGVAIILLTLTVKGLLLPFTNWSMRSMEKMRAIQPKMAVLKEKYGKDQQRFQQEMMKLYREEGVSPFGGCLPMVIQLPIWFALYRTILNTAELYHATFIPGWLDNLAAPEPGIIKILPLAMGVTMFLMQKMQPTAQTGDDAQAKMQKYMLYFMPPFFTFIMYGLPSGLTLYIFVNNILSILQQMWIRKRQAAPAAATAQG